MQNGRDHMAELCLWHTVEMVMLMRNDDAHTDQTGMEWYLHVMMRNWADC